LLGVLCCAELGAAMPEAGGSYIYLGRGVTPIWGFLYGWTSAMILLVLTGTYQELVFTRDVRDFDFCRADGPGSDSTTPYRTGSNPPLSSLGLPLDHARLGCGDFRDQRELVVDASDPVFHRAGCNPVRDTFLLPLAQTRHGIVPVEGSCIVGYVRHGDRPCAGPPRSNRSTIRGVSSR
jgi:hypothetical protein